MQRRWKKTLEVSDVWCKDWNRSNIHELGKIISKRICKLIPDYEDADKYGFQLLEIIEALENICTEKEADEINADNLEYYEENDLTEQYFEIDPVEEFDNWWDSFYDFADRERIWVNR